MRRLLWLIVVPVVVAIVSGVLVEHYKHYIWPDPEQSPAIQNSHFVFSVQAGNNDLLGVVATNDGDRPGSVSGGTITVRQEDKEYTFPLRLIERGKPSRELARLVPAKTSAFIEFALVIRYRGRFVQDMGGCELAIRYTDFDGKESDRKIEGVDCTELRGILTRVSTE